MGRLTFTTERVPALAAVMGLIFATLVVFGGMLGFVLGSGGSSADPFDGHCYVVVDMSGNAYPSDEAPLFTNYGIVYRTGGEEGVVGVPSTVRVNRVCLATPTSVPVTPQPRPTPQPQAPRNGGNVG